ncbi:MAG: hypothetical protein ACOC28_04330 [Alkalispirochaetaceae bacterium]
MRIHYYLSVFPIEALIASQLEPEQFGQYMAIGSKNGSYEMITFFEIEGGFGEYFDWNYAEQRCVQHETGEPKHSVWMSVYRVLEHVPESALGNIYLTTKDGRSLALEKVDFQGLEKKFYVYQELCPLTPLVTSAYDPKRFAAYMTDPKNKVSVPKVVFADLKVIDFDNPEATGNIGGAYDHNLDHLKDCVADVLNNKEKPNKNVERSIASFSYQIIDSGIYVGSGKNLVEYRMLGVEEIRQNHYHWGRSAMIL